MKACSVLPLLQKVQEGTAVVNGDASRVRKVANKYGLIGTAKVHGAHVAGGIIAKEEPIAGGVQGQSYGHVQDSPVHVEIVHGSAPLRGEQLPIVQLRDVKCARRRPRVSHEPGPPPLGVHQTVRKLLNSTVPRALPVHAGSLDPGIRLDPIQLLGGDVEPHARRISRLGNGHKGLHRATAERCSVDKPGGGADVH